MAVVHQFDRGGAELPGCFNMSDEARVSVSRDLVIVAVLAELECQVAASCPEGEDWAAFSAGLQDNMFVAERIPGLRGHHQQPSQ
jgi:hypothetical protein